MKPILLTTAMLFALTPMQAASFTSTDTSNWNGYYRNDPLTAGTFVSGTASFCVNDCFGPHEVNVYIIFRPSLQYGSLNLTVDANSGSPDALGIFPPSAGYFPRYELNHVEASGTAAFIDALTLFTGGIGTGNITFHLAFPHYIPVGNDAFDAFGSFTAGGSTAVKQGTTGGLFQTITIPFTDGISIPISGFLRAFALDYQPNNPGFGASGGAPNVRIEDIQVFDPTGVQLSGYSYSSESNAPYPFVGGTAVPEPGSFALMGMGVIMLIRRRVVTRASI
jgi:hypothetical protein